MPQLQNPKLLRQKPAPATLLFPPQISRVPAWNRSRSFTFRNQIFIYKEAQNTPASFSLLSLIFVGIQYGTWFISFFWGLEFELRNLDNHCGHVMDITCKIQLHILHSMSYNSTL